MIAVATGTGVGINALLSKSLGEKNFKRAIWRRLTGVFLAVCSYIVFALLGVFCSRMFLRSRQMWRRLWKAVQPMLPFVPSAPSVCFCRLPMSGLLQSTGKTIYTMFTQGLER